MLPVRSLDLFAGCDRHLCSKMMWPCPIWRGPVPPGLLVSELTQLGLSVPVLILLTFRIFLFDYSTHKAHGASYPPPRLRAAVRSPARGDCIGEPIRRLPAMRSSLPTGAVEQRPVVPSATRYARAKAARLVGAGCQQIPHDTAPLAWSLAARASFFAASICSETPWPWPKYISSGV